MQKKLFLLDAMALIFRAYYAMIKSPRYTSKGLNTSAVLGFTNTLYEVLKNEKPTHIAVSFDTGAPTLRHADYAKYKAHREATPEDIVAAIPHIKQVIEAFNIPIIIMDGYEADDIIGTAAKQAEIEGFQVYMMTSDKDYGQLVSENIFMYKPGKFGQSAEVVGVDGICEKYGLKNPEQLIDILGLWGDAADNIPGVPGIGEVKARKLVEQFGSMENIYKNIEEVSNDKLRQALIDNKDQAFMSKMLATIILDVPIDLDFEAMHYVGPNVNKLQEVFQELEFKTLIQRILKDLGLDNAPKAKAANTASDLFSAVEEDTTTAPPVQQKRYETIVDNNVPFIAISSLSDIDTLPCFIPSSTLFFEWILEEGKVVGFVFAANDKQVYYYLLNKKKTLDQKLLQAIFEQKQQLITYQCKQSFKYFKTLQISSNANFFDLQIAHYLIQPENTHQLERLTERYLHYELLPLEKEDNVQTLFAEEGQGSAGKLVDIACEKVLIYQRLYSVFKEEMNQDNLSELFANIEMPLTEVLADMEFEGVKLDVAVLQENSDTLNQNLANLEKEIFALAGLTFNLASPKQLGEVLFQKLQIIENAKLTKTKQYQTGEEVLTKLVNKHPIVSLILEWRTLAKLKSTYIDALPQLINPVTGKIHTTFNQTVTSTGRLSSVNPNLQNIPIRTERGRDIRKAFVASNESSVIVSADYSQIELRIVASICGDERMIAAFRNGEDIHASMAAHIYNVPLAEVTSIMRRNAKTVNFGILYGMSAFGLSDRLHISQREARDLIDGYFNSFPKINEYLEGTLQFAREHGYVETLLGRRRYIRDINSHNAILRKASERNAINAPIQGTAADLIKVAMVKIGKALKEQGFQSKMILQVHDELIFDVPQQEIDTLKPLINDLMSRAMQLSVPLSVEIDEGNSWYEAH